MVVTSTCPCALREPDRSSINAKIKYAGDITLITRTPSLITAAAEGKSLSIYCPNVSTSVLKSNAAAISIIRH